MNANIQANSNNMSATDPNIMTSSPDDVTDANDVRAVFDLLENLRRLVPHRRHSDVIATSHQCEYVQIVRDVTAYIRHLQEAIRRDENKSPNQSRFLVNVNDEKVGRK